MKKILLVLSLSLLVILLGLRRRRPTHPCTNSGFSPGTMVRIYNPTLITPPQSS